MQVLCEVLLLWLRSYELVNSSVSPSAWDMIAAAQGLFLMLSRSVQGMGNVVMWCFYQAKIPMSLLYSGALPKHQVDV